MHVLLLAVLLLASCSSSSEPELVPGFTGGCQSFTIFVQRQFEPFGSSIRRDLNEPGEDVGLSGNEELQSIGWTATEQVFYPENPAGLQGTVWYYVPELPNGQGSGWIPDVGVRSVETEPAPGNEDKYFYPEKQASPKVPECELLAR